MTQISDLPDPPYYAVIFTSTLALNDPAYAKIAVQMGEMAAAHPGCLGFENARGDDGLGITVSYWRDEAAIAEWKADAKHLVAQKMGINQWYSAYGLRVAKVERAYTGPNGRSVSPL